MQTVARDSVSIREYWLPVAYDESGAPGESEYNTGTWQNCKWTLPVRLSNS